MPLNCPICGKTFIWAQEIKARRDKKEAGKEKRKRVHGEVRRKQRERKERERQHWDERKRQLEERKEEEKRQFEQERIKASRIKYNCDVCGKGFADIDFPSSAKREGGKIYCREHIPKTRPCPDCGKEISKKASMCPHCGREFPEKMYLLSTEDKDISTKHSQVAKRRSRDFMRPNHEIPGAWWLLGIFIPFVGFILGIVAVSEQRRNAVLFLVLMFLFGGVGWILALLILAGGCTSCAALM